MKEPITIKVTQDNIDLGRVCDGAYCPIALAIRAARNTDVVDVDASSAYWVESNNLDCVCALPDSGRDFVLAFDNYEPVKPFEFTLNFR